MKKKYAIVKMSSFEREESSFGREEYDMYGEMSTVFKLLLPMHITEWEEMEEKAAAELMEALKVQANIRKQKKRKGGRLTYPKIELDSEYVLIEQHMLTDSEKVNTIQEFKDFHMALKAQYEQEEADRKRKAAKAKRDRAAKIKAQMDAAAEKKIAALEKELEALKKDK